MWQKSPPTRPAIPRHSRRALDPFPRTQVRWADRAAGRGWLAGRAAAEYFHGGNCTEFLRISAAKRRTQARRQVSETASCQEDAGAPGNGGKRWWRRENEKKTIMEVKEVSLKLFMGIARLAGRSRLDWCALKRRHRAARPTWCFGNGFKPQMRLNHTQKSRVLGQSTSKCSYERRGHVWKAKTKPEEGFPEFRNLTPKGIQTAFD